MKSKEEIQRQNKEYYQKNKESIKENVRVYRMTRPYKESVRLCIINGCWGKVHAQNRCRTHYDKWREDINNKKCLQCDELVYHLKSGLCQKHYWRMWRKTKSDQYKKNYTLSAQRQRIRTLEGDPLLIKSVTNKQHRINISASIKQKIMVIGYYSNNTNKCSCEGCDSHQLEFLTIDHINGGGNDHRRTLRNKGSIYRWIIENNFPIGFRVLCLNCNFSLGHYHYCPHNFANRDALGQIIKTEGRFEKCEKINGFKLERKMYAKAKSTSTPQTG